MALALVRAATMARARRVSYVVSDYGLRGPEPSIDMLAFDFDPDQCWKCDAKPGMEELDGACWGCWYSLTRKVSASP